MINVFGNDSNRMFWRLQFGGTQGICAAEPFKLKGGVLRW